MWGHPAQRPRKVCRRGTGGGGHAAQGQDKGGTRPTIAMRIGSAGSSSHRSSPATCCLPRDPQPPSSCKAGRGCTSARNVTSTFVESTPSLSETISFDGFLAFWFVERERIDSGLPRFPLYTLVGLTTIEKLRRHSHFVTGQSQLHMKCDSLVTVAQHYLL